MAQWRAMGVTALVWSAVWILGLGGAVFGAGAAGGFDPGEVLTIGNEYVVLGVTRSGPEAGRFALETTGGLPERPGDDGKPLIYGRPRPWTSYTTVRVDGRSYVFGGPTEKRAGRGGEFGVVRLGPTVRDGAVETICAFGDLEVRQVLEVAASSTSGLPDTVRIVYEVSNQGREAHQVGLRLMLDTMLGENDGAPIRLGERTLTGDSGAEGTDLPSFWQAFDSLSKPNVMAQGTVADPTTVRPDRIVVTNWGNLADHLWEVALTPGKDFTREGEYELDSAVALYWEETPLQPGESRLYATAYGLGGVTIIPGELTLGITAPATVVEGADGTATFPVVVYVQNVGKWPARSVEAALELPEGLSVEGAPGGRRLVGDLGPGEERTLLWNVRTQGQGGKSRRFRVEVTSSGGQTVAGERGVNIQGPPQLRVEARPLPAVRVVGDGFSPDRVSVEAQVSNAGPSVARLTRASILLSEGWRLAPLEKREKFLGSLAAGESRTVRWVVQPEAQGALNAPIEIRVSAPNARGASVGLHSEVPALIPRIYPAVDGPASVTVGSAFRVDIRFANVEALEAVEFEVEFDAERLAVAGVSRGEALVGAEGSLLAFNGGTVENSAGRIRGVKGKLRGGDSGGTLVTLHVLARKAGEARVTVSGARAYAGRPDQQVELGSAVVTVRAR